MTDTPIRAQWLRLKIEYPGVLVLMRLGDFLEAFDNDAEEVARILDLQLVRKYVAKGVTVPMAGFPWAAREEMIAKLLAAGWKVAVTEQVSGPAPEGTRRLVVQGSLLEAA